MTFCRNCYKEAYRFTSSFVMCLSSALHITRNRNQRRVVAKVDIMPVLRQTGRISTYPASPFN